MKKKSKPVRKTKKSKPVKSQMVDMGIVNGVRLTYFGGNVFATPMKGGK